MPPVGSYDELNEHSGRNALQAPLRHAWSMMNSTPFYLNHDHKRRFWKPRAIGSGSNFLTLVGLNPTDQRLAKHQTQPITKKVPPPP